MTSPWVAINVDGEWVQVQIETSMEAIDTAVRKVMAAYPDAANSAIQLEGQPVMLSLHRPGKSTHEKTH